MSKTDEQEYREFAHTIAHMAQSQIHDIKTTKYGRISSYDPENHSVKVIIPQDRDENDEPYETEMMPLGSLMSGNKFGVQFAPKGGATKDDPDKGELVAVTVVQRNSGLMKAAHLCYDETMEPPGSGKEDEDEEEGGEESEEEEENKEGWDDDPKGRIKLKGGEMLVRHESGTFVKFYENGDLQLYCTGNMYIYGKGDINLVVREGDLNATIEKGDVNVEVDEGDVYVEVQEGDVALDLWEGDLSATVELGDTSVDTPMGDTSITSEEGSILVSTVSGDIGLSTEAGSVAVEGIDVQVIASGIVDLIAPVVNAGNPAIAQAVLKEVAALIYNEHTHSTPSGQSGPPDVPMTPGLATTVEFYAS